MCERIHALRILIYLYGVYIIYANYTQTEIIHCCMQTIKLCTLMRYVAHCFQVELEFRNVGFCEGRKTGEPGEKASEQRREPTTNSTHIWRQLPDSNAGHIDGRRPSLTTASYLVPFNLSVYIRMLSFRSQIKFEPRPDWYL